MKCSKCSKEFEPTSTKKHSRLCVICYREYQKAWREKRIAQGLSVRGLPPPKEWWDKYQKEYYQRPEVKKRKAAQMQEYRKNPELRLRHMARWILNQAIQSGRIIKLACENCGESKTEGHHINYMEPLNVVWLCRNCHKQYHAKAEGNRDP